MPYLLPMTRFLLTISLASLLCRKIMKTQQTQIYPFHPTNVFCCKKWANKREWQPTTTGDLNGKRNEKSEKRSKETEKREAKDFTCSDPSGILK